MAASFGRLLALAIAMFCASFFAGHLPLSVTLSERAMAFTTVFGAGMIVGTALVVILPEGVETLAASQAQKARLEHESGHQHRKRDSRVAEQVVPKLSPRSPWPQPQPAESNPSPNSPPATTPAAGGGDPAKPADDHGHDHDEEHEEPRLNRMIGTSLLAGFVTMFLIEQIQARTAHVHHASNPGAVVSPGDASSSSVLPQPLPTSDPDELDLDEVSSRNHLHRGTSPSRRPARTTSDDATNMIDSRTHMLSGTSQPTVTYVHHHSQPTPHAHHQVGTAHSHSHSHSHSHTHEPGGPSYSSASGQSVLAATIGLVIHSFSDGVAMGAASAAALPALETAVFLAILLHKGPSAFGLTTYLMHHGTVSTRRIRSHLLAFSLAAPLAAITTFLALRGGGGNDRDIAKWTGLLLLFSAGSFLYVATVHVLPEVLARRGGHLSAGQVAAMVVGMMVPILIQVDHHH